MRESIIQRAILKYINSLPHCVAENVHGNAYQSGRPDINACIYGLCVRLEVKKPTERNNTSDLQEENIKRWQRAGALCAVVCSTTEAKAILNPIIQERSKNK